MVFIDTRTCTNSYAQGFGLYIRVMGNIKKRCLLLHWILAGKRFLTFFIGIHLCTIKTSAFSFVSK